MSGPRPSPTARYWAPTPGDLADTSKCPACFTPLGTHVCARCGLDVRTEGASELFAASRAVLGWEEQRQRIILDMRRRQRSAVSERIDASIARDSAPTVAAEGTPPAVSTASAATPSGTMAAATALTAPAPTATHPAVAASSTAPPPQSAIATPDAAATRPTAPRSPRRRPTVQAVLLTTGVVAVSVTAVFFLLVAYVLASLEVRSAIIAVASIAVIVIAIVLRRRSLRATAEGIAALAIVLLLLDVWIIRANDLFATGGIDPLLHAGIGTAAVAGLGLVARRAAPLRATSVFAAVALPLSGAAVVAGALDTVAPTEAWAAAIALSIGGLVGRIATRANFERAVLTGATLVGATVAAGTAWVALPDHALWRLVTFGAVAAVFAFEWFAVRSAASTSRWRRLGVTAMLGYATAGGAIGAFSVGEDAVLSTIGVAAVAAGVSAALVIVRAGVSASARPQATAALIGGVVVAAPSLASAAGLAGVVAGATLGAPILSGLFAGDAVVPDALRDPDLSFALVVISLVSLLLAALRRRPVWTVVAVEVVAVSALVLASLAGVELASAATAGVVAIGAAVGMLRAGTHRPWLRMALYPVAAVALAFLLVSALTSRAVWPWAAVVALALLIATTALSRVPAERAVVGALALVAAMVIGATYPAWAGSSVDASLLTASIAAAALLGVAAARPLTRLDAGVFSAVAFGGLVLTGPLAVLNGADGAEAIGATLTGAVAAAGILTVVLHRLSDRSVEVGIASVVGPVALVGSAAFAGAALQSPVASAIGLGAGAVVGAVLGALVLRRGTRRVVWDSATGAAIVLSTVLVVLGDGTWAWLPLLLDGVAFAIIAFALSSPFVPGRRRVVGWAALAYATAGLWQGLAFRGHDAVASYTLPLAGALLLVAAIPALHERRPSTPRLVVATAAAALAVIPTTLAGADALTAMAALLGVALLALGIRVRPLRPLARDIVALTTAVSVLALISSAVTLTAPPGPLDASATRITITVLGTVAAALWLTPSAVSSRVRAVAAAVVPIGIAFAAWSVAAASQPRPDAAIWAIASSVVTAGLVVAAPRARVEVLARSAWTAGTVSAALGGLLVAISTGSTGTWLALLLAGVALAVLSAVGGDPFRSITPARHLGWAALALGAASLWWALVHGGVTEVELYTLPVAGALAATAAAITVRSLQVAGAGRSAVLATSLAVALIPSAVAGLLGDGPRATITAVAAGVLSLAAPFLPVAVRGLALRLPTLLIALPTLVALAAVRATLEALSEGGLLVEAWSIPTVAVALAVGSVWAARHFAPRSVVAATSVIAVIVFAGVEALAIIDGHYVVARLVVTLGLLGAAHVLLATIGDDALLRIPRAATLLGLIVLTAIGILLSGFRIGGGGTGAVPAVELATAPTAIALLAAGLLRLERRGTLGSWAALGPGLVLLLLPSLLLDFGQTELWRAVVLGVVAFAVAIAGLLTRLRAPLIAGTVTFAVHAIAQLWPWISTVYDSVPWWLWIGVGGVVLIVIAARYEHRVKNVKDAVLYLGALR